MQAEIIQTAMGVVGSLGFALLFGIRGTKPLGCIALGSGIGWVVYLVSVAGGHGKAFGMLACYLQRSHGPPYQNAGHSAVGSDADSGNSRW